MQLLRALPSSLAMLLLSAPVLPESIRNWTAPRSWTPPRSAALEKIQRVQPLGSMGAGDLPTGPLPFFGITPCRHAWLDTTVIAGPGAAVTGCDHGTLPP